MMYADDNNKCYPASSYRVGLGYVLWVSETVLYYQYIKNREVFFCPSSYNSYDSTLSDEEVTQRASFGNYSSNVYVMPQNDKGVKYTKIKYPANIVIFYDGGRCYLSDFWWKYFRADYGYYLPGAGNALNIDISEVNPNGLANVSVSDLKDDYMSGRHNEGVNLAYCDGHVEWKKSVEVIQWSDTARGNIKQNPFRPKSW